jgi:AraC-like DNA-binding protein
MQQKFLDSYFEAWNEHDATGVAGHFCPGGMYCDIPSQQQLSGQALVRHLCEYFSGDHYRYEVIGEVLFNRTSLAFQYRALPLNGDPGDAGWYGAEFIAFAGDSARQVSDYYRLPESAAPAARQPAAARYAKSGLSDERMGRLLRALDRAMNEDRLFLDPDLSLPALAARLGCSVNHLSQAINAGHQMSFFDYINQFRVQRAATLLREPDCRFPAIIDIALSVGFNSTSTFYTAFKKATGDTPARYRRRHG